MASSGLGWWPFLWTGKRFTDCTADGFWGPDGGVTTSTFPNGGFAEAAASALQLPVTCLYLSSVGVYPAALLIVVMLLGRQVCSAALSGSKHRGLEKQADCAGALYDSNLGTLQQRQGGSGFQTV